MKDFESDPKIILKESTNENDLYHLLTHLWTQDTHILPTERQRVQQGFIKPLIALTLVQPSGTVESSYVGISQEENSSVSP